tara:strand:+ start:6127 stop:6672 length:546 start_codon:yes stop_codon:yes gene_type:complete
MVDDSLPTPEDFERAKEAQDVNSDTKDVSDGKKDKKEEESNSEAKKQPSAPVGKTIPSTVVEIAGVVGEMQAEPRVFAHDANLLDLTIPQTGKGENEPDASVSVLDTGTAAAGDEVKVLNRGACLYVGGAGNVDVQMEGGQRVIFKSVSAGAFLPILVTKVYLTDKNGLATTNATDILALF